MWWRIGNIKLNLKQGEELLPRFAAKKLGVAAEGIQACRVVKKSVDARDKREIFFVYTLDVQLTGKTKPRITKGVAPAPLEGMLEIPNLDHERFDFRPVVIGAGPAGLFSALYLAKAGLRPLVLERGRDVERRAADVEKFWTTGILNPESNVAFGEGGAGTFSDGKLTTRISDPRVNTVLAWMVQAGAPEEIKWLAKPHVGTDRLREVVRNLRERVRALGGEVVFEARVTGLFLEKGGLTGVEVNGGKGSGGWDVPCRAAVLATGHSARDVYRMLHEKGLALEAKAFAIGARVEHPQQLIDRAQYGASAGHPRLGAADYHLTYRSPSTGRAAYTFCMCPGGQVVAAATEEGGVVTNGMSNYARDAAAANSAVVAAVTPDDFAAGPLGGVAFQRHWEEAAYKVAASGGGAGGEAEAGAEAGGGREAGGQGAPGVTGAEAGRLRQGGPAKRERRQYAPAQAVPDFLAGRATGGGDMAALLARASYRPGVSGADLHRCLPEAVSATLEEALVDFGRKIKGFAGEEALLTGVETRTSAPVRIMRNEKKEALAIEGLFPAGEGAGYAGGIVSAAVDGLKVAEALANRWEKLHQ